MIGSVMLVRADGTERQASIDDELYQGDVIETSANGRVGLTFADGTAFSLSPDTRMALDGFDCRSDGILSAAQFSISRGRFAFVCSRAGDNLTINTPFARIREIGRAHV